VLSIKAASVNFPDVLIIQNKYQFKPPLPFSPGSELAGVVKEVGADVKSVKPGDKVMSLGRANWAERIQAPADRVVKLPEGIDFTRAAMLKANPPSAHFMLSDYVELKRGDWVAQNAANSAVGQYTMQLAGIYGFKTVNVVRRDGLEDMIAGAGGDVCAVDGPDLGERVKAATGGADVKLGIDAVAGAATQHLADCLADNAVIANYGLLSGEPCHLSPNDIIFRNISLRGVWLSQWLKGRGSTPELRAAVYEELRGYILDGRMHAEIEATYPLEQIKEAVAHALRPRRGKVLVLPNG